MPTTESQAKARDKWNAKQGRISLRPSKEEEAAIRAAAAAAGMSLQQYILEAVRAYMRLNWTSEE